MSGTLVFFKVLTHLILTTTLCGRYFYYPHFTDEETEAKKSEISY